MLISAIETGKNGPFTEADLESVSKVLVLSNEEKKQLQIEAAKAKGTLPPHLLDYVSKHDEVYELLEIFSNKRLDSASLNRIRKYVGGSDEDRFWQNTEHCL